MSMGTGEAAERTRGDIVRLCRDGLASYKRPRAVVEVAEMPKTATGKIRRNVLRDMVKDVLTDDR